MSDMARIGRGICHIEGGGEEEGDPSRQVFFFFAAGRVDGKGAVPLEVTQWPEMRYLELPRDRNEGSQWHVIAEPHQQAVCPSPAIFSPCPPFSKWTSSTCCKFDRVTHENAINDLDVCILFFVDPTTSPFRGRSLQTQCPHGATTMTQDRSRPRDNQFDKPNIPTVHSTT